MEEILVQAEEDHNDSLQEDPPETNKPKWESDSEESQEEGIPQRMRSATDESEAQLAADQSNQRLSDEDKSFKKKKKRQVVGGSVEKRKLLPRKSKPLIRED
jgi:hypothetical protein